MTRLLLPQEAARIEERLNELAVVHGESLSFLLHGLPARDQISILASVRSVWRSVLSGEKSPEDFIN